MPKQIFGQLNIDMKDSIRLQKKKDFASSHEVTFLAIKTRGNVFKRFLLSQTQAKTPM